MIDHGLIQDIHTTLDAYKEFIHKEEMVSKELVWSLFYTCRRFNTQSKYSRNAVDQMGEFDKLNYKLLPFSAITIHSEYLLLDGLELTENDRKSGSFAATAFVLFY